MKDFEVYAYGVISSSELHLLSMPFPPPDAYAEITKSHFMTGGEALNSAIVLSCLGLRAQLDGNWIGNSPVGERLLRKNIYFRKDEAGNPLWWDSYAYARL